MSKYIINLSAFLGSISDMQRQREQEQSEEEMDRKRKKINLLKGCRAEVIYLASAKNCIYGEKMSTILSTSTYRGLCNH